MGVYLSSYDDTRINNTSINPLIHKTRCSQEFFLKATFFGFSVVSFVAGV